MIRTSTMNGKTTIRLEAVVGVDEVEPLQKALSEAAQGEYEVDLSGCASLSSSAIGALIAAHNVLRAKGGRLRILGANEDLGRLLRLMGLDRHFEIN